MMRKNILGKNEDVKMRLLKTSILMSAPLSLSFFAQSLNMKMTKSVFSILRWWWFALLCFFIVHIILHFLLFWSVKQIIIYLSLIWNEWIWINILYSAAGALSG